MDSKQIVAAAYVVGVTGLLVQRVPSTLLGRWADRGFDGALPVFGTTDQTVTAYALLFGIAEGIVTVGLALGLGCYVARRVDIAAEYHRAGKAIGAGSVIGVTLGAVPIVLGGYSSASMDAFSIFLSTAIFLRMLVDVALLATVGAIAGAALSYFRASGSDPARPSEAVVDSPTDSAPDSKGDDGSLESRPTR